MNGAALREARMTHGWTQAEAAAHLGVTQAYLSMMERGERAVPHQFAGRAVKRMKARATALPFYRTARSRYDSDFLKAELGRLGYPGFAYLRGSPRMNPAELLMSALNEPDLDARVTEALPWVLLAYPDLDWEWLTGQARLKDRQNRLGYTVELARQAAEQRGESGLAGEIARRLGMLEPSRLANEGMYCHDSMTQAERSWLRQRRPQAAEHWNLLTDLTVEQLAYAAS
ncbi:MAG TPA: helix-turn-helix transcriptional regulator [Terracidiphilus sp.]|nr:helix-turn-helix transcriptional regulator [Terracidiphilus sp.]